MDIVHEDMQLTMEDKLQKKRNNYRKHMNI